MKLSFKSYPFYLHLQCLHIGKSIKICIRRERNWEKKGQEERKNMGKVPLLSVCDTLWIYFYFLNFWRLSAILYDHKVT